MSESVQWALLAPVIMLAFLGTLQAGLMLHGRNVAVHAAAAAAEAESAYAASPGAGTAAAAEVARAGGLDDVVVRVSRSPTQVTVEVTGRPPVLLVDLVVAHITEQASAPLERIP